MSGHSKWARSSTRRAPPTRSAAALLEALARDHRRGEGGRPDPQETWLYRTRSRRRARTRCRRTTSSARSPRARRRRRGQLRDRRLRGLRAEVSRCSWRRLWTTETGLPPRFVTPSRSTAATWARRVLSRGSSSVAASCSSPRRTWTRTSRSPRRRCRRGRCRARRLDLRRHLAAGGVRRRPRSARRRGLHRRVGGARDGAEDDRRGVGRVHGAPDHEPRRGAGGHGGRPGGLRQLRHPRGRARSGSP